MAKVLEEVLNKKFSRRDFLKKHLLAWVPKFLERMKGARSNILYPQMCLVLDEFLRKDAGTVQEILKALE